MCGRYALVPKKELAAKIAKDISEEAAKPNFNVAPTHTMPILTAEGFIPMKWGLVPSSSREFKPMFTTINARAETAPDKRTYKKPFREHRCLVPASGFYEWQKREDGKQAYFFQMKDKEDFYFAGLYDIWMDKEGKPFYSYTILTTSANTVVEDVHDRMPVILEAEEAEEWLKGGGDVDELRVMLDPFDGDKMEKHESDPAVGNVRNNYAELMLPWNSV